jgi:hypothetical protein
MKTDPARRKARADRLRPIAINYFRDRTPPDRRRILIALALAGLADERPRPKAFKHAFLLMWQALADGQPDRFFSDCGLAQAGGTGNFRRGVLFDWRDRQLRSIAQTMTDKISSEDEDFRALHPAERLKHLASLLLASFDAYKRGPWRRHSDGDTHAEEPATLPNRLWHEILTEGLKIPEAKRLQQILAEPNEDGFKYEFSHAELVRLTALGIEF